MKRHLQNATNASASFGAGASTVLRFVFWHSLVLAVLMGLLVLPSVLGGADDPLMETGELLTRWTVRVALAFYVAGLASRAFTPRWSRLAWTAGCICYLLHVVCAFHYFHHWSDAEAHAATAKQTAEVVGIDWGGGLYINYAFTLVWLLDVCWWWIDADRYQARPRWLEWSAQGFLGFIAFNATVVFASGVSRWFGIAACVVLIGYAIHRVASRGR